MKYKEYLNQRGFAHFGIIVFGIFIILAVSCVGYEVSQGHNKGNNKINLTSANRPAVNKPVISSSAKKSNIVVVPSTKASVPTPPATATSTSSTTATSTATSISNPAPAPKPTNAGAPVPTGYTFIGTISASTLYNVKVPPSSYEQPYMSLYACVRYTNASTAVVQVLDNLSYGVPVSAANAWFSGLDLSSSPTTDNVISTKTTTYGYQDNGWVNNSGKTGMVNQSTMITTAPFSLPMESYYIWAYGSYDGTVWSSVNNHPSATQLHTCD